MCFILACLHFANFTLCFCDTAALALRQVLQLTPRESITKIDSRARRQGCRLFKTELEQRFARNLQLLALLGSGNGCSTCSADERANAGTSSSPCNTPNERAQP